MQSRQLRDAVLSNNGTELYLYTAIGVVLPNDKITWSIRDVEGKVLPQYQSDYANPQAPWLWIEDYVYRDSQMLASDRMPEEGGRRQFHLDHLGTPRLVTSPSAMQSSVHDYAPFGTELTPSNQDTAAGFDRAEPKQFTGHERDYTVAATPGGDNYLDYMHARYYSPAMGRFLSVDPIVESIDLTKPSTWNRYVYAMNDPVLNVDRDGRLSNPVTGEKGHGQPILLDGGRFGQVRKISPATRGSADGHFKASRSGGARWHHGADIVAPIGTPIIAAFSGKVIEAGQHGSLGNTVTVMAKDGTTAMYAHLDTITAKKGTKVQEGDKVGEAGRTGNPEKVQPHSEDHLHLQMYDNKGTLTNPQAFLNDPANQKKY